MSDHEQVLWLVLEKRRQGLLCFQKVLNCGCKQDERYDRIVLQTPAREHTFAFATQLPCCAYIVTDVFNVQDTINFGKIDFRFLMGDPRGQRSGGAGGNSDGASSSTGHRLPAVEGRSVTGSSGMRDGEPSTSQV